MYGRVGLDVEKARDSHAAGPGDPAEIVSDHVHDHQVLGPVLLGASKLGRQPRVVGRIEPAWGGALHRPAGEPVAFELEEELR